MKQQIGLLFFAATLLCYTSCSKDVHNPDPTTLDSSTIMGFKDSTQLIKSLTSIHYDENGAVSDSALYSITYDTLLKQIVLLNNETGVKTQYNYNAKGLLVRLENSGSASENYSYDYTYDASNIIKSVSYKSPGDNYVYSIEKALLPSGYYRLKWQDPYDQSGQKFITANFDSIGNIVSFFEPDVSLYDSVVYDTKDNIKKVIITQFLLPDDTAGSYTYTLYDFSNRETKGDQLYNFFQILCNGIANIPPDIAPFGQATNRDDFLFLLNKYPVQSTIISRPNDDEGYCFGCPVHPVTFDNTPEFDNKNRLVRYSIFTNDVYIYRNDIIINYYKN